MHSFNVIENWPTWDYLILTASHEPQAASYRKQLQLREEVGLLQSFRHTLAVADPLGRRVGSGGSTLCCLMEVLHRELAERPEDLRNSDSWCNVLRQLRILIIHAGGDSRRLPAYAPCGKLFIPLPGQSQENREMADTALGATLFDRQLPIYRSLPPHTRQDHDRQGQIVITAGDVLLHFNPHKVQWNGDGVSGLGCCVAPTEASRHGVFCLTVQGAPAGPVRRFLQKPSVEVQDQERAITVYGQAVLDMGIFSFDAKTAVRILELAGAHMDDSGRLNWSGQVARGIEEWGLDFYGEIACAFGTETTPDNYRAAVRAAGSHWADADLRLVYNAMREVPCRVQVVKQAQFLHFGNSRQIIESGQHLIRSETGFAPSPPLVLCVNSRLDQTAEINGGPCWIEGCSVSHPLTLAGGNLLVGADVDGPLDLPRKACLDLLPGTDRNGRPTTFIRCYGIDDSLQGAARLCGQPLEWWAAQNGDACDLWDPSLPAEDRSLWNARVFPAAEDARTFPCWLWFFDPKTATPEQWAAWRIADRYSFQEMETLADQEAFHGRRRRLHVEAMQQSLSRWFRHDSRFSAADLAQAIAWSSAPEKWIATALREARRREEAHSLNVSENCAESVTEAFSFARVLHSLGSALVRLSTEQGATQRVHGTEEGALLPAGYPLGGSLLPASCWLRRALEHLDPQMGAWLDQKGLSLTEMKNGLAEDTAVSQDNQFCADWASRAQSLAFEDLRRRIVMSGRSEGRAVRSALRSDEIAWGRAPARLDLAGGWSDTPPYSLENGGTVLNAAVLLNGQPPVQVYGRVTSEPIIRVRSIDLGTHLDIATWDGLFDYSSAVGAFSLVKAALVISGFRPGEERESVRRGEREISQSHTAYSLRRFGTRSQSSPNLREVLIGFGGGLEITTLAAIPKGSGLGTSSIMGATLLAVINRMMGRTLPQHELFHNVLRLEQELTTGGGWQDQIGGVIGGLKLATTRPGLLPEATVRYVPADTLDPRLNRGQTLLYYTGVTRLAKNILQNVVGRYLDRDRQAMAALEQLGGLATRMAEAMGRKDLQQFGCMIDQAWALNQQLDPHSTTPEIEELLSRLRPHLYGAKLLGAGGGGFLLLIARSTADAKRIVGLLNESPPNDRARFFDFQVSDVGLEVSVC
jgi:fucokinase